jgi:hypothetical protein
MEDATRAGKLDRPKSFRTGRRSSVHLPVVVGQYRPDMTLAPRSRLNVGDLNLTYYHRV